MMKKCLLVLMACIFAMSKVYASDKIEDYTYVVIWNSDGTNSAYKCADRPTIIPNKEYLSLRVNGDTEVLYPITEFRRISFGKTEDFESSVKNPLLKAVYDITPDAIRISGLKKSQTVSVYSADGKCMMQGKASAEELSFDTSSLKTGVYVIKCGKESFKFLKK